MIRLLVHTITLISLMINMSVGVAIQGSSTAESLWQSPHSLSLEKQLMPIALIPFPQGVQLQAGVLDVSQKSPKLMGDVSPMLNAAWSDFHAHAKVCKDSFPVHCSLSASALSADKSAEGYRLCVNADGVFLSAVSHAGLFNGFQTLRQMLLTGRGSFPYCEIVDWPAFSHRGFMHDCGRNFRELARLKKEISLAAQLKVNTFHWHLSDHPGWRIECLCHPRLNSPDFRTRDKHKTYSYKEIRELFDYAAKRNVRIIPELDMPGHSDYFTRAFGFPMHSEKGMVIIGELIDEFCHQIPKEICPVIHFGADETTIPNAEEFVRFVTAKLRSHHRIPMQWSSKRDLPLSPFSIEQVWTEGAQLSSNSHRPSEHSRRMIDSSIGYTNLLDPALIVRRYFFMQPCGVDHGDGQNLGVIQCTWPDGRVDDKSLIPGMNGFWSGLMAMAERAWQGGSKHGDSFPVSMPPPHTQAAQAYARFEHRMQALRTAQFATEPFPMWAESARAWQITAPALSSEASRIRQQLLTTGKFPTLRPAFGANLYFRSRSNTGHIGLFPTIPPGYTIWAITSYDAPKAGKYRFLIGFDAPARSNRRYSGLPLAGQWSPSATRIWLNGTEIQNPRVYQFAGQFNQPNNEWNFEHPLHTEEIWWMLPPIELELKQGKNTFLIEHPYTSLQQSWGLSLIPIP